MKMKLNEMCKKIYEPKTEWFVFHFKLVEIKKKSSNNTRDSSCKMQKNVFWQKRSTAYDRHISFIIKM